MDEVAHRLAVLGFRPRRRDLACWRTVRLSSSEMPIERSRSGRDPSDSWALRRWRDLLGQTRRPIPYRITRLAG